MVNRPARAVMVLGTASNVGKSLLVAAICRRLANAGVRVAPFKAQNMSLNSAATPDGFEIGRAQALQAEAARIVPSPDMNPVLLKPMSDTGAQAVVQGRIWGEVHAGDYGGRTRAAFWPSVCESYERLAREYDVIVIEGAGSPAEINLRESDIVNMAMAHHADARCVLAGDIDRGGVFAAIYGTLALLDDRDRARFDGFIVNKFRGDRTLLQPGIDALEARIGLPCFGVVPHLGAIGLDEEDGVPLEHRWTTRPWEDEREDDRLRVAVVALPHLANYTDFDALAEEPSLDVRYTTFAADVAHSDVVILPGTKDTIRDLHWLRERGIDRAVAAIANTRMVIGICGGLQMLGTRIDDPHRVEAGGSHEGLALLELATTFDRSKTSIPVRGRANAVRPPFDGYEIHVGATTYGPDLAPFAAIRRSGESHERRDGAVSADGRILATYVHGVFADDAFRHAFIDAARTRAGLVPAKVHAFVRREREARLNALADAVAAAVDLPLLVPQLRVSA